jgi:hypothetical protein
MGMREFAAGGGGGGGGGLSDAVSFTPVLTSTGTAPGFTYSVQTGLYIPVSTYMALVESRLDFADRVASPTGGWRLTGFPFTFDGGDRFLNIDPYKVNLPSGVLGLKFIQLDNEQYCNMYYTKDDTNYTQCIANGTTSQSVIIDESLSRIYAFGLVKHKGLPA